jgi:hypothetical protein
MNEMLVCAGGRGSHFRRRISDGAEAGRPTPVPRQGLSRFSPTGHEFESRRVRQIIAIFPGFIGLFGHLAARPQYGPQCLHRLGEAACQRHTWDLSPLHYA